MFCSAPPAAGSRVASYEGLPVRQGIESQSERDAVKHRKTVAGFTGGNTAKVTTVWSRQLSMTTAGRSDVGTGVLDDDLRDCRLMNRLMFSRVVADAQCAPHPHVCGRLTGAW